ncbi:MAG: SidA/IucD/PvdA family monooxygenase, partial [Niabella sp.]
MQQKIYDIMGIGIGPFNLGLAALCDDIPELSCIFIDSKPAFDWHPGMMIPGTRMQVPFYADLVTPVNPRSRYSFLNYLCETNKIYRFGINEQLFITRKEYNNYCQWVSSLLKNLRFNETCTLIECSGENISSQLLKKKPNAAAQAFRYAANALQKSNHWLGDYFRRMKAKGGNKYAIVATARKLAI